MAIPFLGELKLLALDTGQVPSGWAPCDGTVLQVSQNQDLAKLFGNRYGGDGVTTFALPDMRGAVPAGAGRHFDFGARAGEATHALTGPEIPTHTHLLSASTVSGSERVPGGAALGAAANLYADPGALTTLHPATLDTAGDGTGHENMQPYLALTWCVCLNGTVPVQS